MKQTNQNITHIPISKTGGLCECFCHKFHDEPYCHICFDYQTSKQLRERLDYHINQIIMMSGGKELPQSQKEFVNKVLLDSVREEYKGRIEGLKMEKVDQPPDITYVADADKEAELSDMFQGGYNQAVDEFNSKLDEVLKKI